MLISSRGVNSTTQKQTILCLITAGLLILGGCVRSVGGQVSKSQAVKQHDAIRKKVFQPALDMLRKKQVPFDPKLLLHDQWREELKVAFEQMAELRNDVHAVSTMRGVYLAQTLFLPEQVELLGDTLILARELAPEDENSKITISGAYSLVIFVIGNRKQYAAMRKGIQHRSGDFLQINVEAPCGIVGIAPVLRQFTHCRGLGFIAP